MSFLVQTSNHTADGGGMSDGDGHENAYLYKWPWMDQRAYNMSASGIDGKRIVSLPN